MFNRWGCILSDKSSTAFPCDFTIIYSDNDVRAYRKFMAARYDTHYTFFGLLFVAPLAIGFVVLGAFKLGSFPPVALLIIHSL